MKTEHFNELTEDELERLAILAEECAEVQQVIMKIIRHGYSSHNPFDESETTNRKLLEKELGDVYYVVKRMRANKDIDFDAVEKHADKKAEKVKPYLHHQNL